MLIQKSIAPHFYFKNRKNSAPHGAELPSATGGSRACRTPECAKFCSRPRQLRLCRMRCGASSHIVHREEKELRATWSRASIRHRRQQNVPHSGVREALLAPTAAPALPDAVRSVFDKRRKSSAPHGAELPSATGGSRACRTPECAKLCSRLWQLRLCRMGCGASSARGGRTPHHMEQSFHPPTAAAERDALQSAQTYHFKSL